MVAENFSLVWPLGGTKRFGDMPILLLRVPINDSTLLVDLSGGLRYC